MVYADTGAPLDGLERGRGDGGDAPLRSGARDDAPLRAAADRLRSVDAAERHPEQMPMHRIALGDDAGTEYYVSERSGEPVLRTTASGRFWGYLGAVLHWLYFTPLRRHDAFWSAFRRLVSLIGTVMCAMGIAIGIWRYSLSGRFRLRGVPSHTPYAGWMKWHHYAGLFFGFFACTWAFSGALSLDPFAFLEASPPTRAFREAATGGPIDLHAADRRADPRGRRRSAGSVSRRRSSTSSSSRASRTSSPTRPPSPSESAPWRNIDIAAASACTSIAARARLRAAPGAGAVHDVREGADVGRGQGGDARRADADAAWLDEYDAYYYSQDGRSRCPCCASATRTRSRPGCISIRSAA